MYGPCREYQIEYLLLGGSWIDGYLQEIFNSLDKLNPATSNLAIGMA